MIPATVAHDVQITAHKIKCMVIKISDLNLLMKQLHTLTEVTPAFTAERRSVQVARAAFLAF